MRLLVLGSGAGGGLPQWNALNTNGRAAFERSPLVPFRTQCSIAATVDGASWALFNAAPDLRHQILANPQLHPRIGPRSSPIRKPRRAGRTAPSRQGGSRPEVMPLTPAMRPCQAM